MYRGGWVLDYPVNANFIRDLYGSKSDGNQSGFSSKTIDDLIAKADSAPSLDESVKLYQDTEKEMGQGDAGDPALVLQGQLRVTRRRSPASVDYAQDGDPILTGVEVPRSKHRDRRPVPPLLPAEERRRRPAGVRPAALPPPRGADETWPSAAPQRHGGMMGRYVARRLLQMIPVFIGTTLLIFLMVHVLPGDPIRAMWGDKAADPAQVASLRHEFGLDQPLWKQYIDYMGEPLPRRLRHDLRRPARSPSVMETAFPVTLRLAVGRDHHRDRRRHHARRPRPACKARQAPSTPASWSSPWSSSPIPVFVTRLSRSSSSSRDELGWLPPNRAGLRTRPSASCCCPASCSCSLSLAFVARLTRNQRRGEHACGLRAHGHGPRVSRAAAWSPATCCATRSSPW